MILLNEIEQALTRKILSLDECSKLIDLISAYGYQRYEEGYNDGERSAKAFPRVEGS